MASEFILGCDYHVKSLSHGQVVLPYYLKLLRETTEAALSRGITKVIHAGDLWHEKHGVNSDVLVGIFQELQWAKNQGVEWVLLRGNHEISLKSEPHNTLLSLFAQVATVHNKIGWESTESGYMIGYLPWYLADVYKAQLAQLLKKLPRRAPRLLITHIGLAEGQLSPSNYYRVPQGVCLKDLQLEEWKLVFAGDYHACQKLADNMIYGGAPIQHTFGDVPRQAIWHLDLTGPRVKLSAVELQEVYPKYLTYNLERGQPLSMSFEPHNFYRLRVDYSDSAHVEMLTKDHPNVMLDLVGMPTTDVTQRRLQEVNATDPMEVLQAYMALNEYDGATRIEAEKYLRKAQTNRYGAVR